MTVKKYDTVIFDLDGTLLNTLGDLAAADNHALAEAGLPGVTLEQTRLYVGNGVRNLMLRSVYGPEFVSVFGDIASISAVDVETRDGIQGVRDTDGRFFALPADRAQFEDILSSFRKYYSENMMVNTKPYDGIPEFLAKLSEDGFAIAVVSNKFDSAVKELCAYFFPDIKVAVGQQESVSKKPAPDMVYEALHQLGKDRGNAVYVGDSEVDVQTAANAGMKCISCLWGFRGRKVLEANGADTFAKAPEDIAGWLDMENGMML